MGPAARVSESIEVRTADDWSLRADLVEASEPRTGVAVLAHAAMARRTEFDRPRGAGLARFLADRGWQTIAFDFRGHGESRPVRGPARPFRYDDFVEGDVAAVCDFARWQAGDRNIYLCSSPRSKPFWILLQPATCCRRPPEVRFR